MKVITITTFLLLPPFWTCIVWSHLLYSCFLLTLISCSFCVYLPSFSISLQSVSVFFSDFKKKKIFFCFLFLFIIFSHSLSFFLSLSISISLFYMSLRKSEYCLCIALSLFLSLCLPFYLSLCHSPFLLFSNRMSFLLTTL